LADAYEDVRLEYQEQGIELPVNHNGRNFLDCLVINRLTNEVDEGGLPIQTVRCPFLEGSEVFPGSMIRDQSHVQLVVRNPANILGVFRPNFSTQGALL
jgi:hypothetical protein